MGNILKDAFNYLAAQPNVLFIGQMHGTRMAAALADVPAEKKIELPVVEELQMGMGIGLALEGFLPVLIYPRCDFLLRAMDQLVNHLDRIPLYSAYRPKVIVFTAVGSKTPLDAGPQHKADLMPALIDLFERTKVYRPRFDDEILSACQEMIRIWTYDDSSSVIICS